MGGLDPHDIVCHGRSIYFTGDDTVRELGTDGRLLRKIITKHLWPSKLCVDDTGRLYVDQGSEDEVWVIEKRPTDTHATSGDKREAGSGIMSTSIIWRRLKYKTV